MGKCRHFLEGKCTYGDGCKFEHIGAASGSKEWKDEVKFEKKRTRKRVESFIVEVRSRIKARLAQYDRPSLLIAQELAEIALAGSELPQGGLPKEPLPGTKTQLCPDFLLGNCILGVTCLLAHGPDEIVVPKDEMPKPDDEEKPPMRLIVEEDNLGKWIEVDLETLDKIANSKEAYRYKTSLCRLFDVGACPKGELCVFAHGDSELQLPGQTAKQMRRLQAAPEGWLLRMEKQAEYEKRVLNRVRREPTRASLCKHFDLGQCRHGKSCKFAHGEEELEIAKKNETEGAQKAEQENAAKAAAAEVAAVQAAADDEAALAEVVAQSAKTTFLDAFKMPILQDATRVPPTQQVGLTMPTFANLATLPGMIGLPTAPGMPLLDTSLSPSLPGSSLANMLSSMSGTITSENVAPLTQASIFGPHGAALQNNDMSTILLHSPLLPPPPLAAVQTTMLAQQQLPIQILPTPLQQMHVSSALPSFPQAMPMVAGMPRFM